MKPEQCRAARALLNWNQAKLAETAKVSEPTIRTFEKSDRRSDGRLGPGIQPSTKKALMDALSEAGIQFLDAGDTAAGAGVALRLKLV